ncbi:MAG TPA: transporter substrate-binding domain-containing protein [Aliidongia sp.]|uniref:substrate-binding periplasmic protein n=1 Tax=Aliidongia sp. TaxID=1914230 RepID=UPI002DDCA794|nr:transporter substrate-binding domain-containing protein [Aliidongia sp.]HEV2674861.1 transporter substrate-binding domain-containing protein [Aliidongia sp.]
MTKFLFRSLIGALAIALSTAARADTLTIAGCENYAPYSDAALPGDGFANDLTTRIMRQAGYDTSVTMLPWIRALEETEAGRFDILPSAWRTEDRAQTLLFSAPIAMSRLVFVKAASSPFEFRSLEDLAGLTVGTIAGYTYEPEFLASPLFERPAVTDILLNLKMVAARHIDLTLDDELTLRFIIRSRAPDLAPLLALTQGVLSQQPLFVSFSKQRPDAEQLLAAFNTGLARMRADGSYQRLLALHQME